MSLWHLLWYLWQFEFWEVQYLILINKKVEIAGPISPMAKWTSKTSFTLMCIWAILFIWPRCTAAKYYGHCLHLKKITSMYHQVNGLSTRLKYFLFNLWKIGGPIHPRSSDHLPCFIFSLYPESPMLLSKNGNQF